MEIGSIVLLSIPEFLWGLLFILVFGVFFDVLPFTGRISPEFQRPVITHFLLIDTLLVGRPDMTLDVLKHMLAAGARAGSCLRAGDHSRAVLEPARCLPGRLHSAGALSGLQRAGHPAPPRVPECDRAHPQSDGRSVRVPFWRHASHRGHLLLSRDGQSNGRCRAQCRSAHHPDRRHDLWIRGCGRSPSSSMRRHSFSIRSRGADDARSSRCLRRILRGRVVIGFAIVLAVAGAALFAPALAPHNPRIRTC